MRILEVYFIYSFPSRRRLGIADFRFIKSPTTKLFATYRNSPNAQTISRLDKHTRTKAVQVVDKKSLSRDSLYRRNFQILERAFEEASKDRFGCVGISDLQESIEKCTGVKDLIDEISRLISHADTHGDGRVSFEHYMQAIRERKVSIRESVVQSPKRRGRPKSKTNILQISHKSSSSSSSADVDDNVVEEEEDTPEMNLMRLKILLQKPSFKNKIELRFLRSRTIDPPRLFRLLQSMVKHNNITSDTVRTLVRACKTNYVNKISLDSLYNACRKVSIKTKKKNYDDESETSSVVTSSTTYTPRRPGTASSVSTTASMSNILKRIQEELKFSIGLERLRKAFVQSDTRRSGAAEISSLRRALRRMDLESGNEAIELFLQYCDTRGDGEVTYGNFIKALREEA